MESNILIEEVAHRLDALLPAEIQFLEQRDPFRFLISVILSAQTTDRIVNAVVRDLFAVFPTKQSLADATTAQVEQIIFPTGYYRNKAKHIIACAQALLDQDLPDTMEELVKLPGVGRKTASCVLGDIYGKPAIIVDTHFSRVVNRLGLVSSNDPVIVERQIRTMLAAQMQYRFSMTVNLFGRTTCHAKKPECEHCPLGDLCPSRDGFLKKSST
ncbi:MAG: endonuclease III [Sphaerochaeta sp.]|jgi:endonuclease-3|uniref:endonuclease III domain-containing protein n=1 Tax=Sphaerochaeta sp. TaxID=1972642 RepID=UPI002FC598D6